MCDDKTVRHMYIYDMRAEEILNPEECFSFAVFVSVIQESNTSTKIEIQRVL